MKITTATSITFFGSLLLAIHMEADNAYPQVPPLDPNYVRILEISREKERQKEREAQRAAKEQQEEQEVMRQRDELRRNPGSFPRTRYSYEAAANENPWARKDRPEGVKVEIFVADRCPDCQHLEQFLDEVDVPYSRYFLTPGSAAEEQYLAQVGRGILPVTRINRKIIRGFHAEAIRKAILEEKENSKFQFDDK